MLARPHPDGIPDALDVCVSIELHALTLAHPHLEVVGLQVDQPTFTVRCYCFICGVDVGPVANHDVSHPLPEQRDLAERISHEQMHVFVQGHLRQVHPELLGLPIYLALTEDGHGG